MGLLASVIELFESIFKRSSPEVQRKQLLKKMDLEIQSLNPLICKNGFLQPNFGEAIFTLYKNVRPLDNLFKQTVSPNDIPRQHRFEAQLMITGYSEQDQEIVSELQFQNRKQDVLAEYQNSERVYIHQRHQLEKVIRSLNSDSFKKIDKDILTLRQLVEFCGYNFVPFMQIFDSNFIAGDLDYTPNYTQVDIGKAINLLEDLYYQISGLQLTNSTAAAVLALSRLKKGAELDERERQLYLGNLKKINFVLNQVLSVEKLKKIIRYFKADPNYEPSVANYTGSPRQEFAKMLQSKFETDEKRIKLEIQDEKLIEDVSALFPGSQLDMVRYYNQDASELLQNETPLSFQWIMPIRILKTFEEIYISDSVKALLNDVVIEGFFNNSTYKTDFSTIVYAVINGKSDFEEFEQSFESGQPNSIAVLEGYIKDSRKNSDFYSKLEKMVLVINNQAHDLLQNHVTNLNALYKELSSLLADARKPSSEIIQNLKVLLMSSRNKDHTFLLESQFSNWKIFFEIMKNYVIINSGEIQHES